MFGAPSGAFFGVYGAQSGTESRTSSLMTPLNALVASDGWAPWAPAAPALISRPTTARLRIMFVIV